MFSGARDRHAGYALASGDSRNGGRVWRWAGFVRGRERGIEGSDREAAGQACGCDLGRCNRECDRALPNAGDDLGDRVSSALRGGAKVRAHTDRDTPVLVLDKRRLFNNSLDLTPGGLRRRLDINPVTRVGRPTRRRRGNRHGRHSRGRRRRTQWDRPLAGQRNVSLGWGVWRSNRLPRIATSFSSGSKQRARARSIATDFTRRPSRALTLSARRRKGQRRRRLYFFAAAPTPAPA